MGVQGERDRRKTWGLGRYCGSRRVRVQEDIRYSSGDGQRGKEEESWRGLKTSFFWGVLVEHTGASPPPSWLGQPYERRIGENHEGRGKKVGGEKGAYVYVEFATVGHDGAQQLDLLAGELLSLVGGGGLGGRRHVERSNLGTGQSDVVVVNLVGKR